MAIKMVRQPSDTPNINNIDDIVGLRYAYGNQDGYVIDKGNELGYSVDGSNFKVLSGRVVLQGVESDVDANGVTLTVDNVSELRYYTVYYQVNMATNTTSILLSNYDTATYPKIDKGDDLTANTIGIANLELYNFQAQNGIISNVQKLIKSIDYINPNTIIDKSKNIVFEGKGSVNQRIFNSFSDFSNFVFAPDFNFNQIANLKFDFMQNFKFRTDRITIRSTGEILYQKYTNSGLPSNIVVNPSFGSTITSQIAFYGVFNSTIYNIVLNKDSIFISLKKFDVNLDLTTAQYQNFVFDFSANTELPLDEIKQITLIYFSPQTN